MLARANVVVNEGNSLVVTGSPCDTHLPANKQEAVNSPASVARQDVLNPLSQGLEIDRGQQPEQGKENRIDAAVADDA